MQKINALKTLTMLFFLATFASCSSMDVKTFDGKAPGFNPENYFLGETLGQGYFYDRFGRIQLSFAATLSGKLEHDTLVLDEKLTYDSGEVTTRTYQIKKVADHTYEVTCADFVGKGTIQAYGNALQWKYILKQNIKSSTWHLVFDDWMFLKEGNLVLNRAKASKLGIEFGEVFMVLSKPAKNNTQ